MRSEILAPVPTGPGRVASTRGRQAELVGGVRSGGPARACCIEEGWVAGRGDQDGPAAAVAIIGALAGVGARRFDVT
jgi:hypothetical protein